jgi:uncharacterized membrane protein
MFIHQPDGKHRIRQLHDLVGAGALAGAFWGLLIGLLLFVPLLGAAIGAATGALAGTLSHFGIDDNFIREVGHSIQPGKVALFLLTSNEVADKVLLELKAFRFQVVRTSLSLQEEARLREALGIEVQVPLILVLLQCLALERRCKECSSEFSFLWTGRSPLNKRSLSLHVWHALQEDQ